MSPLEFRIETTLSLETIEILLMCSLLCSSDVIAAVSLIKPKEQPKLFSLVFGEGIVNDAVSIILFNTVVKQAKGDAEFTAGSAAKIGGDFCALGVGSLALGLAYGLAISYVLKHVRSLTKTPVVECALIFSCAYLAYVTAEIWHQSGIITLLTCGVTMAHYAWFSLSPQGKATSTVVFQFLGFLAEGFVFSYLGLTFFSYRTMPFSLDLIYAEAGIIMTGRLLGTLGLIGVLKLCGYEEGHPSPVNWSELLFIWYAGLIRGAIAFGLVLRIDDSFANRGVIVTTCLTLVLFTTIVFGSTVGLLSKCLFRKPAEDAEQQLSDELDANSSASSVSAYEEMEHPNKQYLLETPQAADLLATSDRPSGQRKRPYSVGCAKYLQRFDEAIMKPLFIYKYERTKSKDAEDFFNVMLEEGNALEAMYKRQKTGEGHKLQKFHITAGRKL